MSDTKFLSYLALTLTITGILFLGVSSAITAAMDCEGNVFYVMDGDHLLHERPSLFAPDEDLKSGTQICVVAVRKRILTTWLQVRTEDGREGWVDERNVGTQQEYRDSLTTEAPAKETPTLTPVMPVPMPATGAAGVHSNRLERLVVSPHLQDFVYDRSEWRHWTDADGDCQNTRAEVLIAESLAPVTFRANNPCVVHSGLWAGPWGGARHTLASELDIDHHVPLFNAHLSGGARWSAAEKRFYANDLSLAAALQATRNSLNRQKGGRGPEEWRPPLQDAWCVYAQDWIDVKHKYSLTVTVLEKAALQDMLATCEGHTAPAAVQPVMPTSPSRLPEPGEGEGAWYTVVSGDSLGRIAARHGCQLHVLVAVNQISNPSVIHVGARLWIPTHCAALASLTPAFVPPPTPPVALPLPTATLARTSTPIPPVPTPTPVPPPALPQVHRYSYQCTEEPYNPPPTPTKPYKTCSSFSTRDEFDQYYGGSFHRRHDRDKDCIPCENLN